MRLARTLTHIAVCSSVLLSLAACSISSNKNGGGDNVRISTPFGGMHVQANQTTASDVGLPQYPGSTVWSDNNNKSANVNMSFGSFHLKVLAVSYQTADSVDKVFAFYRKSLAQYGDVLECQDDRAIGQPTVASSGLTCEDDEHGNGKHVHAKMTGNLNGTSIDSNGHQLRAGTPRSFRVVDFDRTQKPGVTKFGLVYLELPKGDGDSSTN